MKYEIENGELTVDGERFVIDIAPGKNRRPSDVSGFTLVKTQAFLNSYAQLATQIRPRGILELGVFQGGSFVLIDKIFRPERMSAVEIDAKPVAPLMDYVRRTPGRSVHFGTSQGDCDALTQIVDEDLGGTLDLVIDDASHHYDLSRQSFETLWPRLSPGGLYVIEDWAWAHTRTGQEKSHPWASHPALTNLLFEQIMLLGSGSEVAEIRVMLHMYVVKKLASAEVGPRDPEAVWKDLRKRGKPRPAF